MLCDAPATGGGLPGRWRPVCIYTTCLNVYDTNKMINFVKIMNVMMSSCGQAVFCLSGAAMLDLVGLV